MPPVTKQYRTPALLPSPIGRYVSSDQDQGWVGSRLRLWLRLPEAGLFAKILTSRPASTSKHSKVGGFGLGLGFLKCCFSCIRFLLRNILTAGLGFGLGFLKCCARLPRFNRLFDKTFIHKL